MKKHWFWFLLAATLLTGMTIGIGAASETANAVPKEVFAAGSYKASNGLTIPYRYYLPESYRTTGKTYPVFIFGGFNSVHFTDKCVVTNNGASGRLHFMGGALASDGTANADLVTTLPYSITVDGGDFYMFSAGNYRRTRHHYNQRRHLRQGGGL